MQTLPQPLIRAQTWAACAWLFGPRIAAYLIWQLLPANLPAHQVTVMVLADLAVLAAQMTRISGDSLRASGPLIHLALRLAQLTIIVTTVSMSFDRLADAHQAPPPAPIAPATLPVRNETILFSGPIDLSSYNALAETLHSKPTVRTLRLTSEGGNIAAARGMARLVAEAQLNTEGSGICASACTLVFMAGTNRLLLPGARLGFHAYRLNTGARLLDTGDEQSRDRNWLLARGVSKDFLDQAFATPHISMWFPDRPILSAAGILTPERAE